MTEIYRLIDQASRGVLPPETLPVHEWAEQRRRMGAVESAYVGQFSFRLTPWWRWFLARWSEPDVKKGVSQKSAQAGWTQNVVCNTLGHNVAIRRAPAIAMFPKEGSARNFDLEKFGPMVASTPTLAAVLPVKSRARGQKTLFKSFPGGFIKFVGSNSISDVKSTSAKLLIIEEPDDCNLNLKGQGDAIKLLEERGKTFRDVKLLVGGTPSIKGVSSIEDEMLSSDQNKWHVPCSDCGEFQALEWQYVRWTDDAPVVHPIFGRAATESARYVCVHCGCLWTNEQKNAAVQRGHAVAGAPFRGVLGLYINELYAPWHESRLQVLVERYLTAKFEQEKGNLEAMIVFHNACLGVAWEFVSDVISEARLADRGEDYEPYTVPERAFVLTAGIDVQHDRLAVIIRAWGRGEESWLVLWDELAGNPVDKTDDVWIELDELIFSTFKHASGAELRIRAVTIDSGDGTTAESVYSWVRSRSGRGVDLMAGKGSTAATYEIFRRPSAVMDTQKKNTKVAKFGLRAYMVGVIRAKDVLLGDKGPGRISLEGTGPGRFHWYKSVREDYIEQLLSEVKVPVRGKRGARVWEKKKGVRNEVLDAEIYAMHAGRSVKVHSAREATWAALEAQIVQSRAKSDTVSHETPEPAKPSTRPALFPSTPGRANWVNNFR